MRITNQVPSLVRFPSEDLNPWLKTIYASRYSYQNYDSVLCSVQNVRFLSLKIVIMIKFSR